MAFVDTEQRNAGEVQQKVGRIKLSEAIRIGARLHPHLRGWEFFDGSRTCAFGAAAFGAGYTVEMRNAGVAINEFLRTRNIYPEEIKTTVHEMNITQSRESIADWLSARGL